jgi:sugar O-acyltransferase (sialic acid O-acetyltransferase NeuD family)
MQHLAILGASGHGKVVADAALSLGWSVITFFDDAIGSKSINLHDWRVEGNFEDLLSRKDEFDGIVVAIGNNAIREQKLTALAEQGAPVISVVHPSAAISSLCRYGPGTVILANAVVNIDACLGLGVIVNSGAVVEHDCILDDCVHLSPGATLAGGVRVGRRAWIGASAAVKQLVSVGDDAVVGMGAVVLRDVPPKVTVVGTPSRPL